MINQSLHSIPNGDSGTERTLNAMKDIIGKEKTNINNIILVRKLTAGLPEKDKVAEAKVLFDHVRKNVRYIADVYGVETLQDLDVTLNRLKSGDCDDHVIATSTLLEIAGIPTRLVAMQPHGIDGYTHVYLDALLDGEWVHLDPIEKQHKMGWEYPYINKKMILPVSMSKGEMQMYANKLGAIEWQFDKNGKRHWVRVPDSVGGMGSIVTEFENAAANLSKLFEKGSMTAAEYSRKLMDLANARSYQATGEDVFKKKEAFMSWAKNPATIITLVALAGVTTFAIMKMNKRKAI